MTSNTARKLINMVGVKCDNLLVTERAEPIITRGKKITAWHCICRCGTKVIRTGGYLRKRDKHSCSVDCKYRKHGTHGMSNSRQYTAWVNMKQSCTNTGSRNYAANGAKGIKVCDAWKDAFENFWEDMGYGYLDFREQYSGTEPYLTRIDRDKDYSRDNCEWTEQRGVKVKVSPKERAFRLWKLMNRRCYDPRSKGYGKYGGAIGDEAEVCVEWRDSENFSNLDKHWNLDKFETFWEDTKDRYEEGLFIGRDKVPGNFTLANCIWTRRPRRHRAKR